MALPSQVLAAAKSTQSATADDSTATGTVSGITGMTHYVLGVQADYSAAVSAIKTITVKEGTNTLIIFRWDFANGGFYFAFPIAIQGILSGAVSVELEASGTGGTTGRAAIFHFEN